MFEIGAFVVYGSGGIFRIDDIRNENFGGAIRKYYVMKSVGDTAATTIFVPTDNEMLVSRMKPMISQKEIEALISDMPLEPIEWQNDTKVRSECFRKIIEGGDRRELLRLMRTVYVKKQELAASGKRVYAADENAMKRAERIIFDEFSAVLGVADDEIIKMIASVADSKTA